MDEEEEEAPELIGRLCTAAGLIMEDVAPLAISRPPADARDLTRHLDLLRAASDDISSITDAARAVARRLCRDPE